MPIKVFDCFFLALQKRVLSLIRFVGTHTVSTQSAHGQIAVSSQSAHGQLTGSSRSARSQLTGSSRSAHGQLTVSSRSAHRQLTVSSRSAHRQLTVSTQSDHSQLTFRDKILWLYLNASLHATLSPSRGAQVGKGYSSKEYLAQN
jgi:hypothetical protein